jgi:hypothetical protein
MPADIVVPGVKGDTFASAALMWMVVTVDTRNCDESKQQHLLASGMVHASACSHTTLSRGATRKNEKKVFRRVAEFTLREKR